MTVKKSPRIIARYGDKVIGWVGSATKCRLYGDKEWVHEAKMASIANLEFTLYEDIALTANINDYMKPEQAFAAMAWFAKERIEVIEAPDGMMASLGLLQVPEIFEPEERSDDIFSEVIPTTETHLKIFFDGEDKWIPLDTLVSERNNGETTRGAGRDVATRIFDKINQVKDVTDVPNSK